MFCVPWVTLWRRTWKGSVLAVWTWLSFRKIGHLFIKLTICGKNQTFSFSFLLHASAALCISYHRDRPQAPSWDTSLVAAGRGDLSFPPRIISVISAWWGGQWASRKHAYMTHLVGVGITHNRVVSFSVSSFYIVENLLISFLPKQLLGKCSRVSKGLQETKNSPVPLFYFSHNCFLFLILLRSLFFHKNGTYIIGYEAMRLTLADTNHLEVTGTQQMLKNIRQLYFKICVIKSSFWGFP